MSNSYDLTQLDSHSFEHMVNSLALTVLGKGVTGLAQGADGGRDGLLTGEAPYPTDSDRWSGTWYIQSKFHKPHLSRDPQKWLISEIKTEISEFIEHSGRVIPDIWIIATNIEPSGTSSTGAYDTIKEAVEEAFGDDIKFDIWGGRKILDFLAQDPQVAIQFGHFLTPGHVLSAMYHQVGDSSAQIEPIINHLIIDQFNDQIYTKLEQAGGTGPKPKIHELFVDLPAQPKEIEDKVRILETLVYTSSNVHKPTAWARFGDGWRAWAVHPKRARAIILKGGPGQGKSTAGQFFCQIQRAALLLDSSSLTTLPDTQETARELLAVAEQMEFKPLSPRIPVSLELKDFASWHGARSDLQSKGVLAYLCEKIAVKIDQPVEGGTLKRAFATRSWFFNFDGLDEVPNDVKDKVADEVIRFVNVVLPQLDSDALVLCTTRPQGYSGQFKELNAVTLDLTPLPPDIALMCAEGVIRFSTGHSDAESCLETLKAAIESPQIRDLMTTPLQSHIMAVVVKDGGRPPEKRWELFENFYQVMKRRESLKNFPETRIAQMLRDKSVLLRAIHCRLGISLHSKAENSLGAETTLSRVQFESLTRQTAVKYEDDRIDSIVDTLMEATVQRLVFVSTPESSSSVRFDVRQLQEFFAAEFLYSGIAPDKLKKRLDIIGGDSHWREVMHFAISALVVTSRPTELAVAINTIINLDAGDSSSAIRIYNRRMGTGSLMVLRLLHEGVLEQEKSVRNQFKDSLIPLYGMMETEITDSLCRIRHPNTLMWLLNCMVDAVFELSESEQINAAAVLAQRLPDTHEWRLEISRKISSSSANYLNGLYTLILGDNSLPFMGLEKSYQCKWFIQLTLEFLLVEDPLPGFKLNLPLRYLRSVVKTEVDLESYDLPKNVKSAVWVMLDPGWRVRDRSEPQHDFDINGIGVIQRHYNWKSDALPDELASFDWESSSPLSTIIKNSILFHKHRKLDSLLKIFQVALKHNLMEFVTHSIVSPLLPFDSYSTPPEVILTKLVNLSQSDLDALLNKDILLGSLISPPYELHRYPAITTLEQFFTLGTIHPKLVLASWLGVFSFAEPIENPESYNYSDLAMELISNNPHAMLSVFSGWGSFASTQPELFSIIRPLLISSSGDTQQLLASDRVEPFALILPAEYDFLPYVAQAVLNELRHHRIDDIGEDRVETLLSGYGLDRGVLQEIYEDEKNELKHRTAALSCVLLLTIDKRGDRSGNLILELSKPLLLLLEATHQPLLIDTISYTLSNVEYYETSIKQLFGEILTICRENYINRYEMQYLLSSFRERSSAPVSSNNVLDSWLEE